jgi:hypothetical protein
MNRNRKTLIDRLIRWCLAASIALGLLSGCSLMTMLEPPENVFLKSLSIEGLTLTPAFDPGIKGTSKNHRV